jgi:uncharacterized membrane protein YkvA (DUF1232 family)
MDDVKYGEVLGPENDAARENRVRKGFWKTFRRALRFIPFSEDLVAGYYCALDPATPPRVRAVLLGALAYFVLPLDAIPDLLAGIGFTDDVTVLVATLALVRAHIRPAHREAARRALADPGEEPVRPGA